MSDYFDADYYCNGPQSGKSNYVDYRWLPDKTLPLVFAIQRYLRMPLGSTVLDFGCARGFVVRAFREIGMEAYGVDISKWAIENCDPEIKRYVSTDFNSLLYDYIISKDVWEHIPYQDLARTVRFLMDKTIDSLFVVVPLTWQDGGDYIYHGDNLDPSHQIRWCLTTWIEFLRDLNSEFVANGSLLIPGIKPYAIPPHGSCGFLTLKRL